jgi:C1A family cysteine protease
MYKFTLTKQKLDERDYKSTIKLSINKSFVELKMPPLYDQKDLGSCVSNAIALCINYFLKINPSRLFIYWNARAIGKYEMYQDTGLSVRDGCKSVAKFFVTDEKNWAYDTKQFSIIPPLSAYNKVINLSDMSYTSVPQDLNSIKQYLINGSPIVFGIAVYSSFMNITGMIPMPDVNTETLLGYHCVVIVGFDDSKLMFKVANSWGTNWGQKGYFYLPYAYVTNTNLSFDFWSIKFNRFNNKPKINKTALLLLKR